MSFEVHSRAIPHFKADISGKYKQMGLRHDCISMNCQSLLNIAHLLHKGGLGRFVSLSTLWALQIKPYRTSPRTPKALVYLKAGIVLDYKKILFIVQHKEK